MSDERSSQRQRGRQLFHNLPSDDFGHSSGDHQRTLLLRAADADQCQCVVVSVDGDTDATIEQCCEGSCSCDDENTLCSNDANDDHDDEPEIIELGKALDYLATVRNIKNVYNSDNNNNNKWQTTRNHSSTSISQPNNAPANEEGCDNKNDDILYLIPNLVNRILIEHYSTTTTTTTLPRGVQQAHLRSRQYIVKQMTRKEKEKMNQLLLAVIVEFSEPYFVKVLRRRQQAKQKKQLLLTQQQKNNGGNKKRSRTNQEPPLSSQFDERAVAWATECIGLLIRPPAASFQSSIRNNGVKFKNNPHDTQNYQGVAGNNYQIPELDALLATSGPHDGLEAEKRMQNALMHSLQSRRLLQSMGMMGRNDVTNACDGRNISLKDIHLIAHQQNYDL